MQGFTCGYEVRGCHIPDLCFESIYGPWQLGDVRLHGDYDTSTHYP
jgi:hypothetical protein